MGKVKLSEFKPYQKMVFKDGEMVLEKNEINGEINFTQLSPKNIKYIYENAISKIEDSDDETIVTYKVMEFITDIENDVTIEDFKEMLETPNELLTMLTNGIIEYMNNLFTIAEKNKKLLEKSNKIKNKIEGK